MKRMLTATVILVLLCGSNVFAKTNNILSTPKLATGKVLRVTIANPDKEIRSELVITDNIREYSFLVKNTTTIYDTKWKAINLNQIKKDNNVRVKYLTTKDGVNEAKTINIISPITP